MAPGLHGSAGTTPRVRAELRASREATRALAVRHGPNPETVAEWRKRATTADRPMGPGRPRRSVLAEAEEAIVAEFRRRTLLPLDDALGCLRETVPELSRGAPHRCLERHGISRLPRGEEKASRRKPFAETEIGYVRIDVREPRLSGGEPFMFLAVDRVSRFTHVAFFDADAELDGAAFLRQVVATFPHALHAVLTDNGTAFADPPENRGRHPETEAISDGHTFDRLCGEHGITRKLTEPYHPWTNGRAERMDRTVKDGTIKASHYPDLGALRAHVLALVRAYNLAKHLKASRRRTPFQAVCDAWKADPTPFKIDPRHLIPGPHT